MAIITSRDHVKVKRARLLQTPSTRRKRHCFLAEGLRLLEEALTSGLECEQFFYTASLAKQPRGGELLAQARKVRAPLVEVSESVLVSLKETKSSQGAIAVFRQPVRPNSLEIPLRSGLVVVVSQVRDPGNLGTMIRMAEAAGVRGMVLTKGTVDPYHPKALRASMGSLFRLPVIEIEKMEEIISMLSAAREATGQTVATVSRGGVSPAAVDLTKPTFLLVGQEAEGLPDELLSRATTRVTIPMARQVESLNVAMATAILLYEFVRQQSATS